MTNVPPLGCTSFMTNVPPLYATHRTVDDNGARAVIANDTNVFVLLLHFKHAGLLGDGPIHMESPLHQRGIIHIDATVEKNRSIIPGLLAAHALSGCDTVASFYGISKGKVIKVLRGGATHLAVNLCLD